MTRTAVVWIVVAGALGLGSLGCSGEETASAHTSRPANSPQNASKSVSEPLPAPVLTWKRNKLSWRDHRGRTAHLNVSVMPGTGDALLQLDLRTGTIGRTDLQVGEQIGSAKGNERIHLQVPWPDLSSMRLADVMAGKVPVKLPITVRSHRRAPAETGVPPLYVRASLREALRRIGDGPITFTTETSEPEPGRADTAAIITRHDLRFVGSGKTLRDIDWIVVANRRTQNRKRRCSGYSGRHSTIEVTFVDYHLTVYDRLSGQKLEQTDTSGEPHTACPPSPGSAAQNRKRRWM